MMVQIKSINKIRSIPPIWIKSVLLYFPIVIFILYSSFDIKLHLDVKSSISGSTQFFYTAGDKVFSENQSKRLSLKKGGNSLLIALPLFTKDVRWDPVDGAGEFVISNINISFMFLEIRIPTASISTNNEIMSMITSSDGINIATIENVKDPSIIIRLHLDKIYQFIFLLAALIVFIGVLLSKMKLQIEASVEIFGKFIQTEIVFFKKLPILIGIACLFWIMSLITYSISIDDEFAAVSQDFSIWIAQGRWTVYLLSKYLLPRPTIPFLPHFIFCISLAISYVLILRAHLIELNWESIILFPLFMAFPTWYFISEFYANLMGISFGIVMCSVALLLFSKNISQFDYKNTNKKVFIIRLIIQSLLLAFSIGAYQSYCLAFISMGLGLILLTTIKKTQIVFQVVLKQVGYLVLVTLIGTAIYYVISYIFQSTITISSRYVDGFVNTSLLIDNPWEVLSSTVIEAFDMYKGAMSIYGVSLSAIGLLMLLGMVSIYGSVKEWKHKIVIFSLIVGILLMPFALNLLAGGAAKIPYRAMVAVPYVIWLFSAVTIYINKNWSVRFFAYSLLGISMFQLMNAHSTYSAASQLVLEHDKTLAAEVYYRINNKVPLDKELSFFYVDFYGAKHFESLFPNIVTSTIGKSFFEWDGGRSARITAFMQLIGYDDITELSYLRRKEYLDYYNDMPIWPAQGAIELIDDVILVKMGGQPGLTHRY